MTSDSPDASALPVPPSEASAIRDKLTASGMGARFPENSERGMALALVADLDVTLRDTLKSRMVADKTTLDQVFSENGSLGQFGAKVRFGYLLGLYSEWVYRDLLTINKIRNTFAHEADAKSFQSDRIRSLTENLKCVSWMNNVESAKSGEDSSEASAQRDILGEMAEKFSLPIKEAQSGGYVFWVSVCGLGAIVKANVNLMPAPTSPVL